MAFPQTPVPVVVELQVGGTWTDVTTDVYVRDLIKISRGRADEGSRPDPATCSLTFNNRAGKYSPRNPVSPYYGLIGRNTPLRVSIPWGSTYLLLPGTDGGVAATPDTTALDVLGDIDVRIDCTLSNWFTDYIALLSKSDWHSSQRSWNLSVFADGTLNFGWSPDGVMWLGHSTDTPITLPASRRLAIRAVFRPNDGAGGNTATFYTSTSIAGPWTQLGASSTIPFTSSIFNSTSPVWVGDTGDVQGGNPAAGRVHAAQVYNGIGGSGGTLVANPDFTAQTPGAATFVDSVGRSWTMAGGSELTNRQVRFRGEVSEWPPRWDVSGKDVWVPIQAAGILRRLGQGAAPLDSPLRRALRTPDSRTLAYWPLEDGRDAAQAATALSGGTPLAASGVTFANADTLPGSLPVATLGAASVLSAPVPASATGEWQIDWWMKVDSLTGTGNLLLAANSTGTVTTWQITLDGAVSVYAYSASGALLGSSVTGTATLIGGGWYNMSLYVRQSGGTIAWTATWRSLDGQNSWVNSGSVAGTSGDLTGINTPYGAGLSGLSIGHLAIHNTSYPVLYDPALGHPGDSAQNRAERLCTENGVPFVMGGTTPAETLMGTQHADTLLTLLGEAAASDGGVLGEDLELPAVSLRGRASRYNQPAALALDYAVDGHVAPPLEPADDDQHVRNHIVVQRAGGSSAPATLQSGPLSVQAPPTGIGLYDEQVTLSLESDSQLPDIAAWRLYQGTQDVTRYPAVHVDLAAGPALIPQVLALREGDRITIAHPPPWLPPETIDQIVEGWDETIGLYDWDIVYNCTPGAPWRVAQLDDPVLGRADTAGSQLASGATSTAGTLSVATTTRTLWTTSAGDFPFDVTVGGERITVTNITGTTSPQTFTVTRSVNGVVKAQAAGADVRLTTPMILAL